MTTVLTRPEGLHAIENASRDEIAGLQLERMKWSVRHAYENSPFYRKRFDAHGVHPDDLRTLADLAKFPFTVKQDLRDTYPFGMFAVPREKLSRIHGSSGTTGKPTVVGYTKKDIDTWADLIARSIYASGGRPGDIAHIAYGYGLFTGGLGAHYGAERLGCTVVPISGGMTERQVTLIEDFKPADHHGDALLHAVDPRRVPPPGASTRARARSRSASSAPSRGPTPCARRSSRTSPWMRSISTAFPRSWGRGWPTSASRPRTGCTSGRTISTRRSSTRRPARCCRTGRWASSSSPPSPRRGCR